MRPKALYGAVAALCLTGGLLAAPGTSQATTRPLAGRVVAWGSGPVVTDAPLQLRDVAAVSSDGSYALALRADGSVVGWGNRDSPVAAIPPGLKDLRAVAEDRDAALAVRGDGSVVGWGSAAPGRVLAPPAGLRDVRDVVLNGEMAIASHNDGTLTVWAAENCDGETDLPAGLRDVVAVAAGFTSGYALRADGTIVGWGNEINRDNLGPNDAMPHDPPCAHAEPPLVRPHPNALGLTEFAGRFTAISACEDNVIALRTDGTVIPLLLTGRIPDLNSYSPSGGPPLVAIHAGRPTNLGILADGTLTAWGDPPAPDTASSLATAIPPGLHDVIAIDTGNNFGLAITTAPR